MSYDPSSGMILFLTKRDKIPRIYGLPAETAFTQEKARLDDLAGWNEARNPYDWSTLVPSSSPPTRSSNSSGRNVPLIL